MNKKKYIFIFGLLVFFLGPRLVSAADIFCVIDKDKIVENQTFNVSVYTDTKGVSINSIESVLSFSEDLLSVESVSSSGSVFSMWVQPPIFSNNSGTISFSGGIPTPGYNGSLGKAVNIVFKAKKQGVAQISFVSANIYANNGLGTDVASLKRGISINITSYQGAKTEEETIVSDKLPPSPVISSKEMPDPESWYAVRNAVFSWPLPSKAISTQILFGFKPDSTPTVIYTPPIKEKEINDFSDGVRYLHVRFKNKVGWGKTAHRKIKIDNTSPSEIFLVSQKTKEDSVYIRINGEDATSGIGKFEIFLDGNFVQEIIASENQAGTILPLVKEGNHEVLIKAYDLAGNYIEKSFVIDFPNFQSPKIVKYPESIKKDEKIEITGISYPNTNIRIWLQVEGSNPKDYLVKSLGDGSFIFVSDFIGKTGLTSFWAEAQMSKDVYSPSSEKYFTLVKKPAYIKISILTIEILMTVIPVIILLIILIYIIFHGYHKIRKMRKRILLDLGKTENEAHSIFKVIKEDIRDSLEIFDKKDIKNKLTEEDNNTLKNLTDDVKKAEEYFSKKIKVIEKEDLR